MILPSVFVNNSVEVRRVVTPWILRAGRYHPSFLENYSVADLRDDLAYHKFIGMVFVEDLLFGEVNAQRLLVPDHYCIVTSQRSADASLLSFSNAYLTSAILADGMRHLYKG